MRLADVPVMDQQSALQLLVTFMNLAQSRGAYKLDDSSKIYEGIKRLIFTQHQTTHLGQTKNGLNEQGADELYTANTVLVEGTDKPFKVTKYEESTIQYFAITC